MSQERITPLFPSISRKKTSPNKRCYFLELPYKIRRHIYDEAGLVSGTTIDMNHWGAHNTENIDDQSCGTWDEWRCQTQLPSLPLNLFAVCRSVYDELRRTLYGENRLVITRRAFHGLQGLERLSDGAIREMRFLIIRLNLSNCSRQCCSHRERRCGYNSICDRTSLWHDIPLRNVLDSDKLVISQWRRVCTRLANNAQPDRLALYIICDCENLETAEMIVKPLLVLPILQDCGLRLAQDYNKELQGLAQDTVVSLTGRSMPQSLQTFRFLDLPKEIQLKILENTALVSLGYYDVICEPDQELYGARCQVEGAVHSDNGHYRERLKCFCATGHSAFNFHCNCQGLDFPYSFFFVSREFRDAAIQVFYKRNRFTAHMDECSPSLASRVSEDNNDGGGSAKVSIRPGLERFPQGSIGFLTSLCLEFRSPILESLQPNRVGWNHWLNTVDLLSREANLAILNLEIKLSETWYPIPPLTRPNQDPLYKKRMQDTHDRLVQPVIDLKGLKNFFVHLNWSTSYVRGEFGSQNGRREAEQRLECMVMGQGYDSWKRGKKGHLYLPDIEF